MIAGERLVSVLRWPGVRSEFSRFPPQPGATTVTTPNQIGVSFSQHAPMVLTTGGLTRRLGISSGSVFANGHDEIVWAEVTEPTEAVEIFPDLAALTAAVAPSQPGPVEITPAVAVRDATVLGLAAVLRRAHLGRIGLDSLQASTLSHHLVEHLAEHYCHPRARPARRAGRLGRAVVDRIAAVVEERLTEPLRLEELAAEAHLSPYHFARAFKRTTRLAPHEFVTARRMDRALALLVSTRHAVPTIAHRLGYQNVSHFRRVFRHHTGLLPSQVRPVTGTAQDPTLRSQVNGCDPQEHDQ
jgi:AraC family transcriptional regulator